MTRILVHEPSPALGNCELTFIDRGAIDIESARTHHANYVETLRSVGATVEILNVNPSQPDAVFVEDVAIILDELAIITTMGSNARRAEVPAMATEISRYREISRVTLPATIEGGDVLRIGRSIYVGESCRTNSAGIQALKMIAEPLSYSVIPVKVPGCLHLKTCITALDPETFVLNRAWLDTSPFTKFRLIDVDPEEPWSSNTLSVCKKLIVNAAYPRTREKIERLGFSTLQVDISEFGKAEAGLTCMSLVFDEVK